MVLWEFGVEIDHRVEREGACVTEVLGLVGGERLVEEAEGLLWGLRGAEDAVEGILG